MFTLSVRENTVPKSLENFCNLSCSKNMKSFISQWLLSNCFDPYCHEMLWTHHPLIAPEPHKTWLRSWPICTQAQQKHWGHNTYSSTPCILHSPQKTWLICWNFSSALKTIPHLMAHKLVNLDVNPKLIMWIVDFLVNCSQTVCCQAISPDVILCGWLGSKHQLTNYQATLSSSYSTSTGSPQGTILSPVLLTLYTNDCTGTDTTPVVKYSDDTAIEDLSNSDTVYSAEVERFRPAVKITGLI